MVQIPAEDDGDGHVTLCVCVWAGLSEQQEGIEHLQSI